MNRLQKFKLLVPALLVLLALVPASVQAQDPRPPSGATLSGEVEDVNPLTVKVGDQEFLLQTAPNLVVNREGKEVKLGDLNKGDKVTFTTNPDNSVARIDVTDAATDESTWLMIALAALAVLVVGGLVWYLTQRRSRDRTVRGDRTAPLSS